LKIGYNLRLTSNRVMVGFIGEITYSIHVGSTIN
jgi:hypothetical protein